MRNRELAVVLLLAFAGWAFCGAVMWIGMAVTSLMNALIIHAVGAAIIFFLISLVYFERPHYMTPIQTAVIFTVFVVLMDIFVVSLFINRNFDMFKSIIGTWLVFVLIFISTYLTGRHVTR